MSNPSNATQIANADRKHEKKEKFNIFLDVFLVLARKSREKSSLLSGKTDDEMQSCALHKRDAYNSLGCARLCGKPIVAAAYP